MQKLTQRHLFGRRPLWLQLVLVEALLQQPTQAGHALHPVEEGRVLGRVLVTLHDNSRRRQSCDPTAALPAGFRWKPDTGPAAASWGRWNRTDHLLCPR